MHDDLDCCHYWSYIDELLDDATCATCGDHPEEDCDICGQTDAPLEPHFFEPVDPDNATITDMAQREFIWVCRRCHVNTSRHTEESAATLRGIELLGKYLTALMEITGAETSEEAVDAFSKEAAEPT